MATNIDRIMRACRAHGVAWRPHTKAHKTPEIAKLQIAAGAIGVTCAKLGEAEVMAAAGIREIVIANEIVGEHKIARLVALAARADPWCAWTIRTTSLRSMRPSWPRAVACASRSR
jgi:D-serine deaminase-like pyridoxal phosphate-dependent protein